MENILEFFSVLIFDERKFAAEIENKDVEG